MSIRYDRSVLQAHADALYAKADDIVFSAAAASAVSLAGLGGAAGFGMALGFALHILASIVVGAMLGGAIGFGTGWQLGQEQAFKLRLQAQELLCQVMIERNTAGLLRLSIRQAEFAGVPLDDAALQALRPNRSLRMGKLGG